MRRQPFYDTDLAYIHDVAFAGYADGIAPGLLEIMRNAGLKDGRVIDLGSGSGIWAKHLATSGYEVFGIDLSPAMTAIAQERVPAATFHVGSVWDYPIPRCRIVTAIGEVLCYRAEDREHHDLGNLFQTVYDALDPGGLFNFDLAEVGLDRHRLPTFVDGNGWACLVRFEYDETRFRLIRHITTFRQVDEWFRRSQERHIVQLYQAAEVAQILRATGFRVRTARRIGSFTLLPKCVAFVARKP